MPLKPVIDPSLITSWHAHVYFDAATRDAAWAFRAVLADAFSDRIVLGRFHERPVGPHPAWSYQIEFAPGEVARIVPWLALNHGALDVFMHPNTDDELRDHRDCAIWLGRSYPLNLGALG